MVGGFMDTDKMVEVITKAMDDKKCKNIEKIPVADVTTVTDFFLIGTGTSTTHLKGIAGEILEKMEEGGRPAAHIEGYDTAEWICIDFIDVVVHLFLERERQFYNIEKLWKDRL